MSNFTTSWTPRTIVKRAGELLREQGVKALAFGILGELGYRRTVLFELELAGYREDHRAVPANIRFELATESEITDLVNLVHHCDEHEARKRIAEGHLCALGYVDDKLAYSAWLALGPVRIDYLDVIVVPSPGVAYSYEVYVAPWARGLGLAKLGMDFRVGLVRKRGFEKCTSTVVPENRAAFTHTLSRGFRPFAQAYSLRLGGLFKRSWLKAFQEPAPLRLKHQVRR